MLKNMPKNEAVENLKKLAMDMNVFALAEWLKNFLAGKNIHPLPPRREDYDTQRWQLADYFYILPIEIKKKIIDADLMLLEKLANYNTSYAKDVILLLKEAPATDINSAMRLIEHAMKNPFLDITTSYHLKNVHEAQKRFLTQMA